MANQPGLLQNAMGELGDFFAWLKETFQDGQVKRETLMDLGLDPDKDVQLQIPEGSLSNIDQYRQSVDADEVAFKSALHDLKILYTATKEFIKALLDDP